MRPYVICLTPVRNEAWILDRFLACASLWADRIIVGDQHSTDGSQEIARRFDKVELLENRSTEFDEHQRSTLLIDAARRYPGPRLLIALDADEVLSANFMDSPEWERVLSSPPGTVMAFDWVNLLPGCRAYWRRLRRRLGFMDDGSPFVGTKFHSQRIPIPKNDRRLELNDIKVLHYALVDSDRVKSKVRWYQAFEALSAPGTSATANYRRYFHPHDVGGEDTFPVGAGWFEGYEKLGIDMTTVERPAHYWWDLEVMTWILQHGPERFRHLPIWDVDWSRLARDAGLKDSDRRLSDPRRWIDRIAHRYLHATQPLTRGRLRHGIGWLDLQAARLLKYREPA